MAKPTRRTAIQTGVALASSPLTLPLSPLGPRDPVQKSLKLGVIADLHGGFAEDAEERLDAFLQAMSNERCDALIQLGDFAYPNKKNQSFADKFNASHNVTIHVIGNHEFDHDLKRQDCYRAWDIDASYYVRDVGGLKVVVLDGNESGSPDYQGGYPSFIGPQQMAWLKKELESSLVPIVILSHQPLAGVWTIDNATEVQSLLAAFADKIILCLNGHSHVDALHQVQSVNYLHLNSASYFWVGGQERRAFYADPLFTILNIDLEQSLVSVKAAKSRWRDASPKAIGYFERKNAPPEKIVTPQIRARQVVGRQKKS